MKTERVTLLTTPEFKSFLADEARREGVSVAELVRSRCEQRPTGDEAVLAALADELRAAVGAAKRSLQAGMAAAEGVLADLHRERARRGRADGAPARRRRGEKAAA
jgi:hypothetical protein